MLQPKERLFLGSLLALVCALTAPAIVRAGEPAEDEPMIEVGQGQQAEQEAILVEAPRAVTPDTHDFEVIGLTDDENGHEVPAVILATERSTGKQMVVSVADDPKKPIVRWSTAFRLRFPELLGFRTGITIAELVELGVDVGLGFFFNNAGYYLNVYPLASLEKWYSKFYAGVRLQKESIFAVLAWGTGWRIDSVIGYRFDTKKGRCYYFTELGMSEQIGPLTVGGWGGNGISNARFPLPSVALGVGLNITSKNPRVRRQ